jgi:HrpA-like RNA helicase
MDAALITVMQIHLSEPEGDILLFLTGGRPHAALPALLQHAGQGHLGCRAGASCLNSCYTLACFNPVHACVYPSVVQVRMRLTLPAKHCMSA